MLLLFTSLVESQNLKAGVTRFGAQKTENVDLFSAWNVDFVAKARRKYNCGLPNSPLCRLYVSFSVFENRNARGTLWPLRRVSNRLPSRCCHYLPVLLFKLFHP